MKTKLKIGDLCELLVNTQMQDRLCVIVNDVGGQFMVGFWVNKKYVLPVQSQLKEIKKGATK